MTRRSGSKMVVVLATALLLLSGAVLAQEQMVNNEGVPLTDGLSEVRSGEISAIDVAGKIITVNGREYRLVPNQNEILERIVGDAEKALVDDKVDLKRLRIGDRISYAVDEMNVVMFEDGGTALFVLGVK